MNLMCRFLLTEEIAKNYTERNVACLSAQRNGSLGAVLCCLTAEK
jgi:hypothetical protein